MSFLIRCLLLFHRKITIILLVTVIHAVGTLILETDVQVVFSVFYFVFFYFLVPFI